MTDSPGSVGMSFSIKVVGIGPGDAYGDELANQGWLAWEIDQLAGAGAAG